jgi:hypothetical protein
VKRQWAGTSSCTQLSVIKIILEGQCRSPAAPLAWQCHSVITSPCNSPANLPQPTTFSSEHAATYLWQPSHSFGRRKIGHPPRRQIGICHRSKLHSSQAPTAPAWQSARWPFSLQAQSARWPLTIDTRYRYDGAATAHACAACRRVCKRRRIQSENLQNPSSHCRQGLECL